MASTVVALGANDPKSGPQPAACSRTMQTVSPMVRPCSARWRAASSLTTCSTSTRTVTFMVETQNSVLQDLKRWLGDWDPSTFDLERKKRSFDVNKPVPAMF